MSTGQYKKSYEGDYTKKYRNDTSIEIERQSLKREYQTDTPKQEEIATPETSREFVEEVKNRTQHPSSAYQEVENKTESWNTTYEEDIEEDDGNYNYHAYPITEIGHERYRNLKTNKEINLDQARNVLEMAGYEPNPNSNIGAIAFAFIAANIAVPFFAPIIAIGYGVFRINTKTTTWVKGFGKQIYKYKMPSTQSELDGNRTIGKLAIGVGVITALIHYFRVI